MDRLQPAYVLTRRPYSNTSLIVELFTLDFGRIAAISKGARGQAGKRGGFLQSFTPLELSWSGRGEVKTLTKVEAKGPCLLTRGRSLYCGFYLNELLSLLVGREDPHGELFAHYALTLGALSGGDELEPLLRRFEVELLNHIGFGVQLGFSAAGDPVEPCRRYHFAIEQGPIVASDGGGVLGETLLALAGVCEFNRTSIVESRQLMRRVLNHYLGGRPLKSRELFRSLYGGGR